MIWNTAHQPVYCVLPYFRLKWAVGHCRGCCSATRVRATNLHLTSAMAAVATGTVGMFRRERGMLSTAALLRGVLT